MNEKTVIPRTALLLGYAGVLPFAALAMGYVIGEYAAALEGFLLYGGLILSFLGGVRWGAAASPQPSSRALALSVLPTLWAFACLTLPGSLTGAWGLMLGFVTLGIADWFFPAPGLADWMKALRARLSFAVVACHLVVIL